MKYALTGKINCGYWSPSMRREWIEMKETFYNGKTFLSPSMRREWIEIPNIQT